MNTTLTPITMGTPLVLPFEDPRDYHSTDSQPSSYSYTSGMFDASFSSVASSYDACCTPSRRGSSSTTDMDGLSFPLNSLGLSGSTSPVNEAMVHPMNTPNYNLKLEQYDDSHLYTTPNNSNAPEKNMMSYDYSQINNLYDSSDLASCFESLPGMVFDSVSSLLFDEGISPLHMSPSSTNFVVPSQTFISEPYRPITPCVDLSRIALGSPLSGYSQPPESMRYFMSPRESPLNTPSSEISSKSILNLGRTPSKLTLESSAALHRIQSFGEPHVRKETRTQVTTEIERVVKGLHRCTYPGCKSEQKGFKRHEHLKRHQRTHGAEKPVKCPFCTKSFALDRHDNYRSHVKLHAVRGKKSRTQFFEAATVMVEGWKRKSKVKSEPDTPGEIYRAATGRGKRCHQVSTKAE